MPLLTTKPVARIKTAEFRRGLVARIIRNQGEVPTNGTITAITEATLTIGGVRDNETANTQNFSAAQLKAGEFDEFVLSSDLTNVWPLDGEAVTEVIDEDIFDVTATTRGQFAQWTLDGVNYTNGVVRGITETGLQLASGAGNLTITVTQAKLVTFTIQFADNLGDGGTTQWTIIEED